MNILVCAKVVYSPHDLRPAPNQVGSPLGFVTTNRADECAIELAVGLRNEVAARITLVSIAPPEMEETLDSYLGLGPDALIRVWDSALNEAGQIASAHMLVRIAEKCLPDLILCGDRAIGGIGSALTAPLLAQRLGYPFLGSVVTMSFAGDDRELICSRLVERGDQQVFAVPLPAVVGVSPESGGTRYPAFARAASATREVLDLGSLGLSPAEFNEGAERKDLRWSLAKSKPRKLFTPPSTASAADRMRMVMGGGQPRKPQSNVIEAPADKAAEQILQFLGEEKLI